MCLFRKDRKEQGNGAAEEEEKKKKLIDLLVDRDQTSGVEKCAKEYVFWFSGHYLRRAIMDDGSLRITNVSQSDAGKYTCVARNTFGASSSSGSLVVKGTLLFVGFHYLLSREFKSFLRLEKPASQA